MYETQLIQFGLTQKQAKVYLACLGLGKSKVPAIARSAGLKRTTTYGIVEELEGMGLLTTTTVGVSKIYQPKSPDSLLDLLESKKSQLQSIIPGLKDLFTLHATRPQINFFSGKQGIRKIHEDIFSCSSKKVRQVVRVKEHIRALGNYSEEYYKTRAAKGIVAYNLHPKSGDVYTPERGTTSAQYKRFVRYLPAEIFHAAMIMIYDNKVAMIATKNENFGFIIESKEFSDTLKTYFDFMWKLGSKHPDV